MLRKIIYLAIILLFGLISLNGQSHYICYSSEKENAILYHKNNKKYVVIFNNNIKFQEFRNGWLVFKSKNNSFKLISERPSVLTFVSEDLVESGVPEKENLAINIINKMEWNLENIDSNVSALKFFLSK